MTSPPPAIAAQNLTLTLGSGDAAVEILKGIDLEVPQGQALALLGPSGSGKSSLMAVLSGLERATSGALSVAGADFAAMDEDALALARRGRIGIVLQAFHLLPTMTALENVATPMELAGMAIGCSPAPATSTTRSPTTRSQECGPCTIPPIGLGSRTSGSGRRLTVSMGRFAAGMRGSIAIGTIGLVAERTRAKARR